jgi:hypothetical protein
MELYELLAQWTGWPPIVALLLLIGIFGVWFYQRLLQIERTKNELLNQQIKDYQSNSPDILVDRMAKRHKYLIEEIEILSQQEQKHGEEISKFQSEKEELSRKLDNVQEILRDQDFPREGKIRDEVAQVFRETAKNQSCFYIPVEILNISADVVKNIRKNAPHTLNVVFPGMNHMYLFVHDKLNNKIGEVSNPFVGSKRTA